MDQLSHVLKHKFNTNQLGHLYLLKCPANKRFDSNFLNNWLCQLIADLLANKQKSSEVQLKRIKSEVHPDVFQWSKSNNERYYTIDMAKSFQKFLSLQNFESPHKFAIITEASYLNEQISNKILKSLEDTPNNCTIFILNNLNCSILSTVKSRSIELCVQADNSAYSKDSEDIYSVLKQQSTFDEWPQEFLTLIVEYLKKGQHLNEVLEQLKSKKELQNSLYLSILRWIGQSAHLKSYDSVCNLLKKIQWFEKSKLFNNSASERFYQLLESTRNCVS